MELVRDQADPGGEQLGGPEALFSFGNEKVPTGSEISQQLLSRLIESLALRLWQQPLLAQP